MSLQAADSVGVAAVTSTNAWPVFQPQTVRYWIGSRSEHGFRPELAQTFDGFPFGWDEGDFSAGEVWYEFAVPDSVIADGLSGVMITRVYLNANVYLNHELIGSGGTMHQPLAKNAHRPLYFTIPRNAWRTSGNMIQIQHKSYPGMGYLQSVMLGADPVLQPDYLQRYRLQQTLPKVLFVVEILMMMLVFAIWLVRRSQLAYLWFSLSMLMLALFTLNHFLIDTVIPHRLWAMINNTAIDWWLVFLSLFVIARLKLKQRGFQWGLWLYASVSFGYYSTLPLYQLPSTILFHGIGFLIMVFMTAYLAYLKIHQQPAVMPYLLLYTSLVLIALNDLVLQLGLRSDGQFILYFAAPVSSLLIGTHIISEFVSAMRQTETHAIQFQQTVDRVKQELDSQYQVLQQVSNEQVKMSERERIYRDLHDDVGAKLLSLFYRAEDRKISHLAKSALEDLRDIVSHKSRDGEYLNHAISHWQNECTERTSENDIDLTWSSDDIDEQTRLDETQYMHLSRMLRETVSNAMSHAAGMDKISVSVFQKPSQLVFQVINNGVTEPVENWQYGRGLSNIFVRARELGGQATISQPGTDEICVEWSIPLETP